MKDVLCTNILWLCSSLLLPRSLSISADVPPFSVFLAPFPFSDTLLPTNHIQGSNYCLFRLRCGGFLVFFFGWLFFVSVSVVVVVFVWLVFQYIYIFKLPASLYFPSFIKCSECWSLFCDQILSLAHLSSLFFHATSLPEHFFLHSFSRLRFKGFCLSSKPLCMATTLATSPSLRTPYRPSIYLMFGVLVAISKTYFHLPVLQYFYGAVISQLEGKCGKKCNRKWPWGSH